MVSGVALALASATGSAPAAGGMVLVVVCFRGVVASAAVIATLLWIGRDDVAVPEAEAEAEVERW